MTSLCFLQKELIEIVNKTNTRLLYAQYFEKLEKEGRQRVSNAETIVDAKEDDYKLLNAFEMLWNLDQKVQKASHEIVAE